MLKEESKIALTQFAHGAGCGCKIAPQVLKEILSGNTSETSNERLLVGNESSDDAAVYDLGNGTALIATTDFFMPIVDDPYDFGRVAAANAISDVYAMGGTPNLALAILGWPVNKLSPTLAQRVIQGAREICAEAKIPLAGGHSIDTLEPMFGLSVNGLVDISNIKRNNTAQEGDLLFLTKALGSGILSTAQKRGLISEADRSLLLGQLTQLNAIGEQLGKIKGVHAMTDVTGFGLLGHLIEMTQYSQLSAQVNYSAIPKIASLSDYLSKGIVPDATYRNWNAYNSHIEFAEGVNVTEAFSVLPDPQTNGGLLFSVAPSSVDEVVKLLDQNAYGAFVSPIGKMMKQGDKLVRLEK